jgi:hypothetical protein
MEWKFHTPEFLFRKDLKNYTWAGHMFFAYDLVRNLKPKSIVELGTYKGTSFFSFCQGVLDESLDTRLTCVDSWEGDEQTDFYNEEVFMEFKSTLKKYFHKLDIKINRMYFDQAAKQFEPQSIDILHIDGLHTYEAVSNDYQTWKGKVSPNGVIIFHDINVAEFGVNRLWNEIKSDHPEYSFIDFEHNYGLGVLFKDPSIKKTFTPDFQESFVQHYFDISLEYRLLQRIAEMENEIRDLKGSERNLDEMLRASIAENSQLHFLLDEARTELEEKRSLLNKRSMRIAAKIVRLIH